MSCHEKDSRFDHLIENMAASGPSPAEEDAAVARGWSRLSDQVSEGVGVSLDGCSDYQVLLPAYLAGELPEARALLVGDHARECLDCRRALSSLRDGSATADVRPLTRTEKPERRALRWIAAAAVAAGIGAVTLLGGLDLSADRALRVQIDEVMGALHLVSESGIQELVGGEIIESRQSLRTTAGSGAFMRLADGSLIEVGERSEVSFFAGRRGTTIDLDHGNLIVHAVTQDKGRLFVATDECEVAVRGTTFALDHGLKGSRVSVIEGEVEVRFSGEERLLHPGDQISTDPRISAIPIESHIAWSRDADEHRALLRELLDLQRDLARAIGSSAGDRASSRLLELTPPGTAVFISMPNLLAGMGTAQDVFDAHLADSERLRKWWSEKVLEGESGEEAEEAFERLRPFADALGAEVVVTMPVEGPSNDQGPLILADLADPEGFRQTVQEELDRAALEADEEPGLRLVEDPLSETAGDRDLLVWIAGDLLVAATTMEQLQVAAALIANPGGNPFLSTELFAELDAAYERNAPWIVGIDFETMLDSSVGEMSSDELSDLEELGFLDATTFVAERESDGENAIIQAALNFDGPRRGMMNWLAEPATMSSLEFVSAGAHFAASVVSRDPIDIFDEFLEIANTHGEDASLELREAQQELGIDLRNDLAGAFGGEVTWALDGSFSPDSWKLIAEVYDPTDLDLVIEHLVAKANEEMEGGDQAPLILDHSFSGGRQMSRLFQEGEESELHWTIADGYLVAAPSRMQVENALQYRDSGANLADSPSFLSLLPVSGYSDCSALVFRNFSDVTDALSSLGIDDAFGEEMEALDVEGLGAPSLYCAWAETDRILAGGVGQSLLSLMPLAIIGSFAEVDGSQTSPPTVDQVPSPG